MIQLMKNLTKKNKGRRTIQFSQIIIVFLYRSNDLIDETENKKITNEIDSDNALITTTSPSIVTTDETEQCQEETRDSTVTNDDEENPTKKSLNNKVKYSSIPYHPSPYYIQDHPYGTTPYYYHPHFAMDKPTPLMFIPPSKASSVVSSRDNQTGNSASISPQNLPPRLRQTSTTENDSNSQVPSTTSSSTGPSSSTTTTSTVATTTNGGGSSRRHQRSILPRGANNYYTPHPPPLMATPPGVLFTYPPAVHQASHIAYNIRPPDEFELLALQQQMMNLPGTPVLWPPPAGLPPHAHPFFAPYSIDEIPPPAAYLFDNSVMPQSASSFLNPEAAEWVPPPHEDHLSSNNEISIDDEISFPPLTSNKSPIQTVTNTEENSESNNQSPEPTTTPNNSNDNSTISTDNSQLASENNINTESTTISSSSQDDTNESSLSSTNKLPPMTYSTIISQTSQSNKANTPSNRPQQSSINHSHNQLPPRDRTNKSRASMLPSSSSSFRSRRQQPVNDTSRNHTRNLLTSELNSSSLKSSTSSELTDDWIEVKSKKTKKFDRGINDHSSEKMTFDEPIPKSLSPPLSLTSTGDNTTTTTFTSEDDFDEKDNGELGILIDNEPANDYNQTILNDVRKRMKNNEKLLILMRGLPGKFH